jgi:hypothetical protein
LRFLALWTAICIFSAYDLPSRSLSARIDDAVISRSSSANSRSLVVRRPSTLLVLLELKLSGKTDWGTRPKVSMTLTWMRAASVSGGSQSGMTKEGAQPCPIVL